MIKLFRFKYSIKFKFRNIRLILKFDPKVNEMHCENCTNARNSKNVTFREMGNISWKYFKLNKRNMHYETK